MKQALFISLLGVLSCDHPAPTWPAPSHPPQPIDTSSWESQRQAVDVRPAELKPVGMALWDYCHRDRSDTERTVIHIQLVPLAEHPDVYLSILDWQFQWWGSWAAFKIQGDSIVWFTGMGQDEQSLQSVESRLLPGWKTPLVFAYGMTHMGHGDVYVYELNPETGALRFLFETFVTDAHEDRNLFSPFTLAMRAIDINRDGHIDLEFHGIVKLLDEGTETPVRKVFLWNQGQGTFIEDLGWRAGFETYSSRK